MERATGKTGITKFRRMIWSYYRTHGRDLPWRHAKNPYHILVSEIMLQQTQVSRILLKYPSFLKRFPNFKALQEASSADVIKEWQGLGYNRRALALKKIAEIAIEQHKGRLPQTTEALMALPGIGAGTAGSLLAFAFNKPSVFIETNIRRVFLHYFFPHRAKVGDASLFPLIEQTVDKKNPREWYYALMDYGSMLGKETKENANQRSKHYQKQSKFKGSNRELRGKVLKLLVGEKSSTIANLSRLTSESKGKIIKIIRALTKEGFITSEKGLISLKS